jgi:hypothetical protein
MARSVAETEDDVSESRDVVVVAAFSLLRPDFYGL